MFREDGSAHWVWVESQCAERKIPDVPKGTSLEWIEVSSGALPCWRSVTVGDWCLKQPPLHERAPHHHHRGPSRTASASWDCLVRFASTGFLLERWAQEHVLTDNTRHWTCVFHGISIQLRYLRRVLMLLPFDKTLRQHVLKRETHTTWIPFLGVPNFLKITLYPRSQIAETETSRVAKNPLVPFRPFAPTFLSALAWSAFEKMPVSISCVF